jgi:Leucine-rich repeat (LRR) protein
MFLILTIINMIQLIKTQDCSFSSCFCNKIFLNNYKVDCKENELNSVKNSGFNLILKSKGIANLESIKNGSLNNIRLISLDLSDNNNDFDAYMNALNQFRYLSRLDLSHNLISIIREKQFDRLINLEYLDLSYNEIFYLEENAFYGDGLNKLVELNLKKNQLHHLKPNDFDNLPNIQTINFDNNKLKTIKCNIFNSLQKVRNISFQFN